jgi:molybdopterin synthase catalytic subunit
VIWVNTKSVGIHEKGKISIQDLVEHMRSNKRFREVGAIASFFGIVRGTSQKGKDVIGLDMEAYEDKAEKVFSSIAEEMKKRPGIVEVLIHHVTGHLDLGDLIFVVMVAGSNRKEVFPTLMETVEKVKRDATIWKKETLSTGESYWVEYAHDVSKSA